MVCWVVLGCHGCRGVVASHVGNRYGSRRLWAEMNPSRSGHWSSSPDGGAEEVSGHALAGATQTPAVSSTEDRTAGFRTGPQGSTAGFKAGTQGRQELLGDTGGSVSTGLGVILLSSSIGSVTTSVGGNLVMRGHVDLSLVGLPFIKLSLVGRPTLGVFSQFGTFVMSLDALVISSAVVTAAPVVSSMQVGAVACG